MLDIRNEQLPALSATDEAGDRASALAELRGRYPAQCGIMGESAAEQLAALSVQRAREHGLRSPEATAVYLGLMVQLGSDFDRDPQLPWAATLRDEQLSNAALRLELTCERALYMLSKWRGDDTSGIAAAMRRVAEGPLERLTGDPRLELGPRVDAVLRWVYPEKHATLAWQRTLSQLPAEATATAEAQGLRSPEHVVLIAILLLMLGAGAIHDPQYPWIREALGPAPEAGEAKADDQRIEALYGAARAYIQRLEREVLGGEPPKGRVP